MFIDFVAAGLSPCLRYRCLLVGKGNTVVALINSVDVDARVPYRIEPTLRSTRPLSYIGTLRTWAAIPYLPIPLLESCRVPPPNLRASAAFSRPSRCRCPKRCYLGNSPPRPRICVPTRLEFFHAEQFNLFGACYYRVVEEFGNGMCGVVVPTARRADRQNCWETAAVRAASRSSIASSQFVNASVTDPNPGRQQR